MGLISGIVETSNERARLDMLRTVHPLHRRYVSDWHVGLDAYDATGGFLDGAYLWQFPREAPEDFDRRKRQARYHNYVATLVDIYLRAVTARVTRTTDDTDLEAWWGDVDGRGTTIGNYVDAVLGQALASGHAAVLMDKAVEPGVSRRDDPRPYLTTYTAPTVLDWRQDRNGLAAVKLAEAAPTTGLDVAPAERSHYLLWDRDEWARYDERGRLVDRNTHDLGAVPLEVLRPIPSRRHPFIGRALVQASVVRALYNRASEEDVVLRDQAFSLFVISLPPEATPEDIDALRQMLGAGVGTTSVQIIKGTADFKTADMSVAETIRNNQQHLIAELYRMAHLRYQRDSLEAESAEAIRLQRQDLDVALRHLAEGMHAYEMALVDLWYRWMSPAGRAEADVERANVQIVYPDDFSPAVLEAELSAAAAAMGLGLGPTAEAETRKRVVSLVLPDLAEDTLETIREEIDAARAGGGLSGAVSARRDAAERLRAAGMAITEAA